MSPEFVRGWDEAVEAAAAIAIKWRDENRAAWVKASKTGKKRHALDGDETQLVMADQLEGAAIECNAIAMEIRKLSEGPSKGKLA